ncbi:MAG: hypothetical protein JRI73_07555 [Deltaproteobacteria bacterium]|nr:hypothetical protein [Deltaproteobacteria bacterium]
MKEGLNSLRDEYERGIEKRGEFREEFLKNMDKITPLKDEYRNALEKADRLKQELIEFFQRYSLQNRLEVECT